MRTPAEEIKKLELLRSLLLDDCIRLAEAGELTPTDRRTIAGLLKDNNLLLDPTSLPQSLRDKLTTSMKPSEGLEEELDI